MQNMVTYTARITIFLFAIMFIASRCLCYWKHIFLVWSFYPGKDYSNKFTLKEIQFFIRFFHLGFIRDVALPLCYGPLNHPLPVVTFGCGQTTACHMFCLDRKLRLSISSILQELSTLSIIFLMSFFSWTNATFTVINDGSAGFNCDCSIRWRSDWRVSICLLRLNVWM